MSQPAVTIPERFRAAYHAVERFEQYDRYLAAYIFGSVARGQATKHSDLDVHVVVDEDNACTNVNHPIIAGVKLDLSFRSMQQIREQTLQTMELRERPPWIADAIIVFDKTNELAQLQAQARQAQPKSIASEEYQWIQFMFFHGDDKVRRNLDEDPVTALFVMHVGLNDFLHYHYQLHQRWWLSSKRLLADLRQWDVPLAHLLEQFVTTSDVHSKFAYWTAIIDHILEPLGGRQPIAENNCDCDVCRRDLAVFMLK
jgi:hypothetical protein